jgi:hypothetical protein
MHHARVAGRRVVLSVKNATEDFDSARFYLVGLRWLKFRSEPNGARRGYT